MSHTAVCRFAVPVVALCAAVACSPTSSPAPTATPAPAPLTSGLDVASFDTAVRPQDDLFRYVNGGWLARTEIPADKAAVGGFTDAYDRTQEQLKAIVEAAAANPGAPGSPAQKIGDFYTAFLDEARADQLGITPLKAEIDRINALTTKSELAAYMARQFLLGVDGTPIVGDVEGDAQEPTQTVLYLYQGGLGMPDRDYYLSNDAKLVAVRAKYRTYLAALLEAAGTANAKAEADGVLALETSLARAHWTQVESRDAVKTYNRVAVKDLATKFPGLDWTAWTTALGVQGAPHLIVSQPSFFVALGKAVEATPLTRWKSHLVAHTVDRFAPYLSTALVNTRFEFRGKALQGIKALQPRWKRAIANLDTALGEQLGQLYVEKHFTPAAKARMDSLVANLRAAFKSGIDQLEWMSPETRREAQAKLAAFRPKIGYPSKWRDYSAVDIRKDDLAGNMLRALEADSRYELAKVGRPVDPEDWGMTPQTINAYYNPIRNEIVFPAAILQPPFFDMAADDAVNYGAIGAVIGHEMGHGFDDQGRRFDAKGALRDWWTAKDGEEFQRRAKGLAAYYSGIEAIAGAKVNGELTLGENIGDLTGLVIAHRAYVASLNGKAAPVMDGLSGDQRFFAGWTQAWRAKARDESVRQQLLADPHAPDAVRATAPLRHVPEFYRAFDVKPGDKLFLAPEQRVKIW